MREEPSFIVIAGNIGAGKTTLVSRLAKRLDWEAAFEPHAENPYLEDFYADMRAWSFHSQTFFLSRRLEQHHRIGQRTRPVLQDRSLYEDAEVFARNLHEQGNMSDRDWATYHALYQTMAQVIPAPSLAIYLRANVPTLLDRIERRKRAYEQAIPVEYLERLNGLYERWANSFTVCPVLTLEAEAYDWYTARDIDRIAALIRARLGLT